VVTYLTPVMVKIGCITGKTVLGGFSCTVSIPLLGAILDLCKLDRLPLLLFFFTFTMLIVIQFRAQQHKINYVAIFP